ncbi:MAG: type I secretion system permease/ATPase [Rickettsiaceae bacterium]|nr:type I secretion system permease/ATPase [Rickettsiaceae bacterium]
MAKQINQITRSQKDNIGYDEQNVIKQALNKCKSAFQIVFVFAFCINLLMLVTPLYSLQVLDRVLGSGNLNTLLMLSLIIAFVYFTTTLLQIARSFTLIKIGEWLDNNLSPLIFAHSITASATKINPASSQLLRDFQTLKTFLTSTGINTLFDAPWSIVYFIIIFLIHPYIGFVALFGAVIIVGFAFFNAVATNRTLGEATELSVRAMSQAEIASRNAEAVEAMGMINNVKANWAKFNTASLAKVSVASYRNGIISNFARFVRNLMQMAVTGIGAYVVVVSNSTAMTTGGMIASSIIVGKALAPFDNSIAMWKSISSALKAYKGINESFNKILDRKQSMPIPNVDGKLAVENVYYAPPNFSPNPTQQLTPPRYILKGISFNIQPGEILAVIGPSGSGKSTLAKLIVGVWQATSGSIRLDGGDVYTWDRENFGEHVGYLPQGIELFSGTVKENIAKMSSEIDPEKVVQPAKMCGAHEMILSLQNGYDTDIGSGGGNLSGGQRQRIGLARAFYGNPKLVVLDEPNANLDEAGELALAQALKEARVRKISVIVISHRPAILSTVDKIMVVQEGSVTNIGTREEIQGKIQTINNGMLHINKG